VDGLSWLEQTIVETDKPRLVYRIHTQAKLIPMMKSLTPQVVMDTLVQLFIRVGSRRHKRA